MQSDVVRTTVRMSIYELESALNKRVSQEIQPFSIYEIASMEGAYKSDDIMHSGVHFNLGSLSKIDQVTRHSVTDLDSLIRQLSIMNVKLPYPRMSLNMVADMDNLVDISDLAKKTGFNEESIKATLYPNGSSTVHLSMLIDSIEEDLLFSVTWFCSKDDPDLRDWGYAPYCSLISLYRNFKDRELPSEETLSEKGLSFLNAYRDQIKTADSCIVNLPLSSPERRRETFDVSDEVYEKYKDDQQQIGHLTQMELFRFLFILNTKGVGFQTIVPDVKKNKRRQKQNLYPLLAYKILKVEGLTIGHDSFSNSNEEPGEPGYSKRLHSCRGHIKFYTIDKPLLGHTVGPVWVRPHMRGKASLGKIVKDYEVFPNPKTKYL